jgi:F0F1-type ATP synthase assembly protein I
MKEPSGSSQEVGGGYRYVSLGFTFAGGIILFMGMGFLLDRWLGWTPILTVVGTLAGAVLSFLNVYWKLQADERQYSADHPHGKGKKPGADGS